MSDYSIINIAALIWFVVAWMGYAYFAKYMAKRGYNLSYVLNRQRLHWMEQVLKREMRVTDAALVANLERNTSFLASTSILVLAGLLTTLGVVGNLDVLLQSIPFYESTYFSIIWIRIKILVLVLIHVYAFFSLTWSMRQYGFASVMIGSAPTVEDAEENSGLRDKYVYASAKVIDMAGHAYNAGLRSYYFSLAVLPWFVSSWLFIASTTLVVVVLYIREFHSRPYHVIDDYLTYYEGLDAEADEGRNSQ